MGDTEVKIPGAGDREESSASKAVQAAIEEAQRCLQCKNKPCVSGCPVNVRIPEFIERVAAGEEIDDRRWFRADVHGGRTDLRPGRAGGRP